MVEAPWLDTAEIELFGHWMPGIENVVAAFVERSAASARQSVVGCHFDQLLGWDGWPAAASGVGDCMRVFEAAAMAVRKVGPVDLKPSVVISLVDGPVLENGGDTEVLELAALLDNDCLPELYLYPRQFDLAREDCEEHKFPVVAPKLDCLDPVQVLTYFRAWKSLSEIQEDDFEFHRAIYFEYYSGGVIRW